MRLEIRVDIVVLDALFECTLGFRHGGIRVDIRSNMPMEYLIGSAFYRAATLNNPRAVHDDSLATAYPNSAR